MSHKIDDDAKVEYTPPEIQVIDIDAEVGFAQSAPTAPPWRDHEWEL